MSSPGATQDKEAASSLGVRTEAEHLEELLDEALIGTFPASDPVAITIEQTDTKKPLPQTKIAGSTDPKAPTVPQE
jgi:hypothetical protein